MVIVPKISRMDVRHEGAAVRLVLNGQTIAILPWDAAQQLARAIHVQAHKAEEVARAEQIIMDQAILKRAGATIGLSSNPAILAEAGKEAAWNTDLRRYMRHAPGLHGIRSGEMFGAPTIRHT